MTVVQVSLKIVHACHSFKFMAVIRFSSSVLLFNVLMKNTHVLVN